MSGFSIIEATLAVVVVAAGVLSIFLLFSAGLDLGTPAVGDTTCAMFADSVLNGLRAESDHAAEQGHAAWLRFWEDFRDGYTNIPVAAQPMWEGPLTVGGGQLYTNIYTNYPVHSGDLGPLMVSHAVRYRVAVKFPLIGETNRAEVTLKTWPGEKGRAVDDEALIFYTEFRDNGSL